MADGAASTRGEACALGATAADGTGGPRSSAAGGGGGGARRVVACLSPVRATPRCVRPFPVYVDKVRAGRSPIFLEFMSN